MTKISKWPSLKLESQLKTQGFKYIIGVDEVGRGCLAGPVVAAAVHIPDKFNIVGIKDSKKISYKNREKLYERITTFCEYSIGIVLEETIDKINIREATKLAMYRAILSMDNADFALIDGDFVPQQLGICAKPVIGGDNISVSIAAASIPYNEEVYCVRKEDNCLMRLQIGDLYNKLNYKDYDVFSFDPKDYKIKRYPITGIVKHGIKKIRTLKLKHGKEISTSLCHSLFKLNDGKLIACESKNIKKGDFIAITDMLPFNNKKTVELNLFNIIKKISNKTNPYYVCGDVVQNILRNNLTVRNAIKQNSKKYKYNKNEINCWAFRKILPIHIIPDIYNNIFAKCKLKCKFSKHLFNQKIKVDKNFAWLLGLYVAEGNKHKGKKTYIVNISNTDINIINKTKKIWQTLFGLKTSHHKNNISICSKIIFYLFEYIGIKDLAENKNIPKIIFKSNKTIRKAFLNGYIEGDGWQDKYSLSCRSVSKNLIKDLELLCLSLNMSTSTYYNKYDGKIKHILERPTTNILDSYSLRMLSKNSTNTLYRVSSKNIKQTILKILTKYNIKLNNIKENINIDVWGALNGRNKSITFKTLKKINDKYPTHELNRIINCDIKWIEVLNINDKQIEEYVYDIEVKPNNTAIENFVGAGGVLLHNSIIAKVFRDHVMEILHEKYPMYGWASNKGYGTKEHRNAIKQYGPCKHHRKSFNRVKQYV